MFNRYEYMRAVTVASVGGGGITDEDGRFLRMIGNLPVKAGDRVWTDGRVVYGHVPIRPQANPPTHKPGYPWSCDAHYAGAYTESGIKIDAADNVEPLRSKSSNWMYTDKNGVYTYTTGSANPSAQRFDAKDSSFYLDMLVTKDTVYTAEFTNEKAPLWGRNSDAFDYSSDIGLSVYNFYLSEASDYTPEKPSFTLHWDKGARVYANMGVRIRKNGVVSRLVMLEDYLIVLDALKEIYTSYDVYDSEIEKRYNWKGTIEGTYYTDVNIWVSAVLVQVLNFHFTDENGSWEMILAMQTQGCVAPHTIDEEYNYETKEYEDVHSYFAIPIPLIFYVVKIDSAGNKTILQNWVSVKTFPNNLVTNTKWVNAKAAIVTPVNICNRPQITINFRSGSIITDLSKIIAILDQNGQTVCTLNSRMLTFDFLVVFNPDVTPETYGAFNEAYIIPFNGGDAFVEKHYTYSWIPFQSSNGFGRYGLNISYTIGRVALNSGGASYLGNLSLIRGSAGMHFVVIHLQYFRVIKKDGTYTGIGPYCHNLNIDSLRTWTRMKRPKTINDLIADVVAGKLSGNQGG